MRRLAANPWPWAIVCGLLLPFLAWQPEAIASRHALDEIWNLGHIVLFACATAAALTWLRPRPGFAATVAVTVTAGLAIGAAIEWLQGIVGRDSSALDVVRDGTGVLTVLALSAIAHRRSGWAVALTAVALPLLTWLVIPPVRASIDAIDGYRQFPILFAGDSRLEIERFDPSPRLALQPSADGDYALHVALTTARYSGFSLVNFPGDWRDYRTLVVDVGNPSPQPLSITCKIQDRTHDFRLSDRYNHRFTLPAGRSRIVIDLDAVRRAPATRQMDMARIDELSCFAVALPAPRWLVVYRIALTNSQR